MDNARTKTDVPLCAEWFSDEQLEGHGDARGFACLTSDERRVTCEKCKQLMREEWTKSLPKVEL